MNEQGLSIADIAMQVGFTSSSYYIKKFHNLYGVTPARYKLKNNEK
jgi:AraC-like DNA-binding protein